MSSKIVYDKNTGVYYGSYKTYIKGFLLSVVLTVAAFFFVSFKVFNPLTLYFLVTLFALIQFYIQLVCFLHLGVGKSNKWKLVSFFFTFIIVFILVLGTLWIMFDLYTMMMVM